MFTPFAAIKALKPIFQLDFEWPMRPETLTDLVKEMATVREARRRFAEKQPQSNTPDSSSFEIPATEANTLVVTHTWDLTAIDSDDLAELEAASKILLDCLVLAQLAFERESWLGKNKKKAKLEQRQKLFQQYA